MHKTALSARTRNTMKVAQQATVYQERKRRDSATRAIGRGDSLSKQTSNVKAAIIRKRKKNGGGGLIAAVHRLFTEAYNGRQITEQYITRHITAKCRWKTRTDARILAWTLVRLAHQTRDYVHG